MKKRILSLILTLVLLLSVLAGCGRTGGRLPSGGHHESQRSCMDISREL